ncbi:MAG: (Fe-S)-binding protein [Cytophagales bacterium]
MALLVAVYFASKSIARIRRNINLGKDLKIEGNKAERIKKMVLIAFGQKKMFDRPIPALLHLVIYVGFLIVNIEMLEIVIDGLLGTHRVFLPVLGSLYPFLINVFEVFAFGVILVCVVFLLRRNVLNIQRFKSPELKKWPFLDANLILVFEIVLMWAFLNMNAIDQLLQSRGEAHYPPTGNFLISQFFIPLYSNAGDFGLVFAERFYWWFHILGVFAFANYLPHSKHLHIILAFPNTYFSRLEPAGKIQNMPVVTAEVKSMLGMESDSNNQNTENLRFGAKDVNDLSWKNILEAYTCTECGRCSSVCPANLTGKKLSPRKVMMDTRDRAEEIGKLMDSKSDWQSTQPLYSEKYISKEELLACTTCNACVDACPVNISPLEIIVELRRFMVMEESKSPASWNAMFSNLETNFSPWKFSTNDRFNWSEKA